MVPESQTNTVFVSDVLASLFPETLRGIARILRQKPVPLRTIPGTKDIWCRDYMPVQTGQGSFVKFRYGPDYLRPRAAKYRGRQSEHGGEPTRRLVKP